MPTKKQQEKDDAEKRLKRWRSKCPQKVAERIVRAKKEKLLIVKQKPIVKTSSKYYCKFDVAGSIGHIYNVCIGKVPTCTCPDYQKHEDACKHTLFVLLKVIGLSHDDNLLYQKAFTSTELDEIFKRMARNKKKASVYFWKNNEEEEVVDNLIHQMSRTVIEEDGGYEYENIRELTGQAKVRDTSTYRPFHWEKYRSGY